jgi:iron complex outermembrane recepter protein
LALSSLIVSAQERTGLSGTVANLLGNPLANVPVVLDEKGTSLTDDKGTFRFSGLSSGKHSLKVQLQGFMIYETTLELKAGLNQHHIVLENEAVDLETVTITGASSAQDRRMHALQVYELDNDYIVKHLEGDLMKTLRRVPGISSIDIGAGQSKPVIRGLSFNRVVVTESGIKHEGQQWGDDHGLEIDRFNAAHVEIIKGPASLMYGSDAIGGVISIKPYIIPTDEGTGGKVLLHHSSNNKLYGVSANVHGRNKNRFFNARITANSHCDYKVPADTIVYNTFDFVLQNGHLRNTAGRELNLFASGGWIGNSGISTISLGNYTQKSGFYSDIHGFEIRQSQIDYDASSRDIQLPYQHVNHLKIISNSVLFIREHKLEIDLAFQNNFRREFAEPIEHGYMPLPPDSLERKFNKIIYDAKVRYHHYFSNDHYLIAGIDATFHDNKIGGWGFIIPSYRKWTGGAFVYNRINLTPQLYVNGGLRFDAGAISIDAYRDWYPTPLLDSSGEPVEEVYWLRSADMTKWFSNLTWSVGFGYESGKSAVKMNAGKGFRIPDARELAADGVNYHRYRQERGDSTIGAETAWQIDLLYAFQTQSTSVSISPFYSWFPNFIYLNPTSGFSNETGLQEFNYVQNEVVRLGGEIQVEQNISKTLNASLSFEYVYAGQVSGDKKGFGLAFSPPPFLRIGTDWKPEIDPGLFSRLYISGDVLIAGDQTRIVPPEEPTPGYAVFNLAAGVQTLIGIQQINLHLQLNNILNRKYFDHTSYYRLINMPSPARNFQVVLSMPFGEPNKKIADKAGMN